MKKRSCYPELIFLLLLAMGFAFGTSLENTQQALAQDMIRMHVVANSDEPLDQEIKLQVRDTVLEAAAPLLRDADSQEGAKAILRENITFLTDAANETLSEFAPGTTATITVQRELFGTRHYENFSLPGGYYDALRVTIGAGEGKNWWCVVYPQICTGVYGGEEAVPAMGALSQGEQGVIFRENGGYELKFKSLEIFENILRWFRSRGNGIPTSS